MFICSSYCLLCMFSVSDSSIYMIYWRSFNFLILLVISCTCIPGPHHLIMYTCACYARHLTLLYVLTGLRLTTLNSHVQILETGPWWPCCIWSEYAADLFVTIGVQQKLGSSPQLFLLVLSCLVLETPLVAREHLSVFVYLFKRCTFVFWWCNIPVILYHSLW